MKEVGYQLMLKDVMEQLQKGAFLTVKSEDKVNTMTIGWGTVGFIWQRPIFMVMVRPTRYTFDLIEATDTFTVSIPIYEDLKKELAYCGMKSGRDEDKIRNLGLRLVAGQKVDTPIIADCSLHYECRIIAKQAMNQEVVLPEIDEKYYPKQDHHRVYYGEIVACYLTTVN